MSKGINCSRCKHRLPRNVCGSNGSPNYRKKIELTDSCAFFVENPAQDHYTLALKLSAANEPAIEVAKELEIAIELGLPQDDEMSARDFLGQILAELAEGEVSKHEVQESINQREKAILMDYDGKYGYFTNPINRATLQSLDANYVLQARSIQKREGIEATISYLNQKISLFNYLSSLPLLLVLNELGNLYGERGDTEKARESLQKLLVAEKITNDENEEKTRQMARDNLRRMESKEEVKSTLSGKKVGAASSTGSWKVFLLLLVPAFLFLLGGIYSLFVVLALAAGAYWWFKIK